MSVSVHVRAEIGLERGKEGVLGEELLGGGMREWGFERCCGDVEEHVLERIFFRDCCGEAEVFGDGVCGSVLAGYLFF